MSQSCWQRGDGPQLGRQTRAAGSAGSAAPLHRLQGALARHTAAGMPAGLPVEHAVLRVRGDPLGTPEAAAVWGNGGGSRRPNARGATRASRECAPARSGTARIAWKRERNGSSPNLSGTGRVTMPDEAEPRKPKPDPAQLTRLRQLGPLTDDNLLIFRDRTPKGRHYTARPRDPPTGLQDSSFGAGCFGNAKSS